MPRDGEDAKDAGKDVAGNTERTELSQSEPDRPNNEFDRDQDGRAHGPDSVGDGRSTLPPLSSLHTPLNRFLLFLRKRRLLVAIPAVLSVVFTHMLLEWVLPKVTFSELSGAAHLGILMAVGVIAKIVATDWFEDRATIEELAQKIEPLALAAADRKVQLRSKQAELRRERAVVTSIEEYFGRELVQELAGFGEDTPGPDREPAVRELRRRALSDWMSLTELLRKGHGDRATTYETQLTIAHGLAMTCKQFIWATCLDSPTNFCRRNYYYLDMLREHARELSGSVASDDMTPMKRIFVGQEEMYRDAIRRSPDRFTELYEWHLRMARSPTGPFPIKFFVFSDETEYRILFDKCNRHIHDFMIGDGRFVYGREAEAGAGRVHLAYVDRRTEDGDAEVKAYMALFKVLWEKSEDMEGLLARIAVPGEPADKGPLHFFRKQCKDLESKLLIEPGYSQTFPLPNRTGKAFYQALTRQIRNATDPCIAVDRADLKTDQGIEAWSRQAAYVGFREASVVAAKRGVDFKRLFVLRDLVDPSEADALRGLIHSLAPVELGFVLSRDLTLDRFERTERADFLILNVSDPGFEQCDSSIGFELRDEPFSIGRLEWNRHLIAKDLLREYFDLFSREWGGSRVTRVPPHDERSLNDALAKLVKKGE